MYNKLIAVLLTAVMLFSTVGCTTTTLQTVEGYVNEFLPVAETVANLVIATEDPSVAATAQSIEAQVNSDLQQIEAIVATITTQNYSDKRAAILALAQDAQTQLGSILTMAHIKNPKTVAEVTALVALGNAVISSIINALPPQNATTVQFAKLNVKIGNVQHNYKHEFNRIVSKKTGDTKVDAVLAKTPKFFVLGWSGVHPTFR